MFWDKWKYEIFDRYTLADKIVLEYKNNIQFEEKKLKKLDYLYLISYLILALSCVIIFYKIKDIKYIKGTIIEEAIIKIGLVLILFVIAYIYLKIIRLFLLNYKDRKVIIKTECFSEGIKRFWNIIKDNQNVKIFGLVSLVLFIVVIICLWKKIEVFCIFFITFGILILYMLNKNTEQNTKGIWLSIISIFTGLIYVSAIISLIQSCFENFTFYNSGYTIFGIILALLINNKFITNLKSYKEKNEEYRKSKICLLKSTLENNKIDKNKYEKILLRVTDNAERYYNLENKFIVIIKSLLAWCGISVVIAKLENIQKFLNNLNNMKNEIETMKNIIIFILILWLGWKTLFFVFKQVIEAKYMSKEDLFEFRDLLQDIILEKDSSSTTD